MEIICKYKFKSECAEAQNVQSQKTLTQKQSIVESVICHGIAESVICHGKGHQIWPTNFQKLLGIQKWKLNKSPYHHPYSDYLLPCNKSP